jgi:tetratricopeptide (TPR) repeat protein
MSVEKFKERTHRDPLAEATEALFPPLHDPLLGEAAEAIEGDQLDTAAALLSKYLRRHPNDPDALNMIADIARRNGRLEEAEKFIARCGPAPCYRYNHAVLLLRLGRYEQALEILDRLLQDDVRNPLYRNQKAKVLRGMNRFADALAWRRELAEDYPDIAEFWFSYGDALAVSGQQDQSISAYRKALDLDPSLTTVYLRLCDLKTYRFSDAEIESIEVKLSGTGLSSDERVNLHFALGKAYGDRARYSESFANYAKANALRRLGVDADPERLTTHRRHCEVLFTPEFFAERSGWGSPARAPIFVLGMPRVGSTLVEQIISSHSAVEGLGELPDLERIVTQLTPNIQGGSDRSQNASLASVNVHNERLQAYPRAIAMLDANGAGALADEYLALTQLRRREGRPFFTDKALFNFSHLGLIHLILPNAKIVDVRRHPLDCGWSCFINHFPSGVPFSYRLGDIGRYYADYVRLMAHFDRVLPGRVHRVIYEHLVADPEREIRHLLEYLELPFEEACLRFHENRRAVATVSSQQVRSPLYRSGIAQWKPYEQWLGPLKAALGPVLDSYPEVPD